MTKKSLLYTAYFSLLVGVVGFKIIQTLFTGSVVIGYRSELRDLSTTKISLEQQLHQHTQTAMVMQSLSALSDDSLTGFEPITKPLQVSLSQQVAIRN